MAARLTGFCYIEPNKLTFIGSTLETPIVLPFSPDLVVDLEVVNRDKLVTLVAQFVKAHQIEPATLALILAPTVTFDRDLSNIAPTSLTTEEQKFKDTVPFEAV